MIAPRILSAALLSVTLLGGCDRPGSKTGAAGKSRPAGNAQAAATATTEEKKMSTNAAPNSEKKFAVPSDDELKKKLTPLQYAVARESDTERPFTNEYWKTNEEGIYVSIVTGEPLFSSKDKFYSDCGWPAFSKPITDTEIKELSDRTAGMVRTEVRSKLGDAHLGHVFDDGPAEKGGKRYCINSASLRFVPKDKMAAAGYGEYLKIFEQKD